MKGFTLLETVLASMVALVVGTFLVSIMIQNTGLFYKQTSLVSEGLSINDVLGTLSLDIKSSSQVAAGYPDDLSQFTTDAGTLVLKIPSVGESDIIPQTYDFAVFHKDANPKILKKRLFPNAQSSRAPVDEVLTAMLDNIEFLYLDGSGSPAPAAEAAGVKVTVTVLSKTGTYGSRQTSSIVANLRNNP